MSGHSLENSKAPEVAAIREALGAIAAGEPAAYRLYAGPLGDWYVRREADAAEHRFASREEALAFARLAVVRCSSYCLYIQDGDGRVRPEAFNWPVRGK